MKNVNFEIELSVSVFKEGNNYVAYTPTLDISTSANTYEKARSRFEEAVNILLEELIEKGTLNDYLESLGWQKRNKTWLPPTVVSQMIEKISMPMTA